MCKEDTNRQACIPEQELVHPIHKSEVSLTIQLYNHIAQRGLNEPGWNKNTFNKNKQVSSG